MKSAAEYNAKNELLMTEYEERVRAWLENKTLAKKIPFFRDGVVCPEVWFQNGNNFRPLFILKEVSMGFDNPDELDGYLEKWAHPKRFEFVQNPFDDVQIGRFKPWIRIAKLAKGLEEIYNGADSCDYYKYNFSFQQGGEEYQGDIPGYLEDTFRFRTANKEYDEIIRKIAVINIKKLGGGTNASSKMSKKSQYYTNHITPFEDLLYYQIELIDPTVIICCGRNDNSCIINSLTNIKDKTKNIYWLESYHPTMSSNYNFYENPLKEYKKYLQEGFK